MRRLLVALAVPVLAGLAALPAVAAEQAVVFRFEDRRIVESSGLAASARHEGIVYTHNDSDAGPLVFAVDGAGETVATLTLAGAPARDWEAASTCEHDGEDVLWVGDIGDNIDAWKTYPLLRVPEPEQLADADVAWTQYDMRYADGEARDAEALLCHPGTGRLYVVSKENAGKAGVYRGPERMRPGKANIFTRVADAPEAVTDGAFFGNGNFAVLRGYFEATVVSGVAPAWKTLATFTPPVQIQGESVAATADGEALLFGSEGLGSSVWRVPLPEDFADLPTIDGIGEDPGAVSPEQAKAAKKKANEVADQAERSAEDLRDASERVNDEGIPGLDGQMIALVSVLGLGIVVLVLVTRRE